MRIMERVNREDKQVVSFVSWCGGLPEASASNVPLAYKFSWSPKAVLTASLNDAEFKLNGEMRTVAGQDLLREHFPDVKLWRGLALEGLANRDSLPYADKYGLGPVSGLRDLFRGTLRYQGFSALMNHFRALGLLGKEPLSAPAESWPAFLAAAMSQALGENIQEADLLRAVEEVTGANAEVIQALQYFSLLPSSSPTGAIAPPALPKSAIAPIDAFAALLARKLQYAPDEVDSVLLHHAFKVVPKGAPDGVEQTVTASLLCNGDERASAMATTVGCTLAFAALRVADGHVTERGVTGPYHKSIWSGVLDELEHIGVKVKESWV